MPQVPRATGPSVDTNPAAFVPQSAAGATPDAFGAVQGRQMSGLGAGLGQASDNFANVANQLAAAEQKIRARDMAVGRARAEGAFKETAFRERDRLSVEEDLASEATVSSYSKFLDEAARKALEGHKGDAESQQVLALRLEEIRTGSMTPVLAQSLQAKKDAVTHIIQDNVRELAQRVSEDPGSFQAALVDFDRKIDNFSMALTPAEEKTARDAGREALAVAALERREQQGIIEGFTVPRPGGAATGGATGSLAGVIAGERSKSHQVSPKGAAGRTQVMPDTAREIARELGETEVVGMTDKQIQEFLKDDTNADRYGGYYIAKMSDRYGGNPVLKYAAYNAGPGAVDGWLKSIGDPRTGAISDEEFIKKIPYKETRDYVPRAVAGEQAAAGEGGGGETERVMGMREMLDQMGTLLSPETRNKYMNRANAFDAELRRHQAKAQVDLQVKLQTSNIIRARLDELGVDTSDPTVSLAIEGVNVPSAAAMTKAQQAEASIKALTDAGIRVTPEMRAKAHGMHVADGDARGVFGNGAQGRSFEYLATQASNFASGTTTPQEDQLFLAAAMIAQSVDPVSGRQGELPPPFQEALRRRGFDPGQMGDFFNEKNQRQGGAMLDAAGANPAAASRDAAPATEVPPTEVTPEEQTRAKEAEQAVVATLEETGKVIEEVSKKAPEGGWFAPDAPLPPNTIYELAHMGTGPIPALADFVGRIPFVGQLIPTKSMTHARTILPHLTRDFVTVLQNNPRYAEGERTQIQDDMRLDPRVLDDPEAFRVRAIAMDDMLIARIASIDEALAAGRVSADATRDYRNSREAMIRFRTILGAPQPFNSEQEAAEAVRAGLIKKKPGGREFRIGVETYDIN